MRIDLHVHTSKYSECGKSDPDAMVQAAIRVGLDALVLAEHNHIWSDTELAKLQSRYPEIKLFRGIEVSISWSEHIVVLGVLNPDLFYPLISPGELMAAVRKYSGAAILAHPFRWSEVVRQDILDAGFDAIEIHSTSTRNYMQKPIYDLQRQLDLPLVATSDGHHTEALGLYAINLRRLAQDEQDLARLIRRGEFSLWTDDELIDRMNKDINLQQEKLSQLGPDIGLKEGLRQVGLNPNLTYAVENNMDILYPKGE